MLSKALELVEAIMATSLGRSAIRIKASIDALSLVYEDPSTQIEPTIATYQGEPSTTQPIS